MPASPARDRSLPDAARTHLQALEHQHTHLSPADWADLLPHLREDLTRLFGLDPRTCDAELDRVRDRALSVRTLRMARAALADGSYAVVAHDTDREVWQLRLADGTAADILAPVENDLDAASVVGRCALHRGTCPSCHRPLTYTGDDQLGIVHTSRCPARR